MLTARIIHFGDRFAVLDKPAGLSLATPRDRPAAAAARLITALAPDDRRAFEGREVELVHRLDTPTSGLVLIALDIEMHRRLARAFAERRVTKLYLALVWGHPRPRSGVFEQPLGPDREDRRRMRVDPEGKPARSAWKVLATAPHLALVALWALTGRTHQLRVHLAAAGHPIVGDDLYGGPRERGLREPRMRRVLAVRRALLHAWRLEVPELEPSRFEAPLPSDFAAVLAAAGIGLGAGTELWGPPENATR
jgi:RluA family pseudouridine synthase